MDKGSGRSLNAMVCLLAGLSSVAAAQDATPQKRRIDQLLTHACSEIAPHAEDFPAEEVRRATQYFTPLFLPGPDGKLRPEDRHACLKVEGSCVVGDYLYNYPDAYGVRRDTIAYKFGKGNGASRYNTTNALDPCRTLAADPSVYPIGTVIFVPDMRNKICPQSGMAVDGCFIIGDIGSAIRGGQRFDIFTGECSRYSTRTNTCDDRANEDFVVPRGAKFHVIQRDNSLAVELRRETDAFIVGNWQRRQ
jgi:3D (Asp-Asp-Asp) domain-containing protein